MSIIIIIYNVTIISILIGASGAALKVFSKSRRLRKKRKKQISGYHLDYSIIEIGKITEKCPGDLLSLRLQ